MRLRPLKRFDLRNLMEARNGLVEYTVSNLRVESMEDQEAWFKQYLQRGDQLIFVLEDDRGSFIGYGQISLLWEETLLPQGRWGIFEKYVAENGYYVKRKYWGSGYGGYLIDKVNEYAFKYLGINRVLLRVLATNDRAISIYTKKGFVEVGRNPTVRSGDEQPTDIVIMALDKKEEEHE